VVSRRPQLQRRRCQFRWIEAGKAAGRRHPCRQGRHAPTQIVPPFLGIEARRGTHHHRQSEDLRGGEGREITVEPGARRLRHPAPPPAIGDLIEVEFENLLLAETPLQRLRLPAFEPA
jgi:hypothetical protein